MRSFERYDFTYDLEVGWRRLASLSLSLSLALSPSGRATTAVEQSARTKISPITTLSMRRAATRALVDKAAAEPSALPGGPRLASWLARRSSWSSTTCNDGVETARRYDRRHEYRTFCEIETGLIIHRTLAPTQTPITMDIAMKKIDVKSSLYFHTYRTFCRSCVADSSLPLYCRRRRHSTATRPTIDVLLPPAKCDSLSLELVNTLTVPFPYLFRFDLRFNEKNTEQEGSQQTTNIWR